MPLPEAPLDPALADLLADKRLNLRPPPDAASVAPFRRAADGYLACAPKPDIASVEDREIDSPGGKLAVRLYRPHSAIDGGVILFLHGGGFVFGGLETHDALCRNLARASAMEVAALDYRLAPEAPFPAALEDSRTALDWLAAARPESKMVLAGDSAGAQLALATALTTRVKPIQAIGLFYPLIDPSRSSESQTTFAEGYMLTGAFLDWAWRAYRGGVEGETDPSFDLRKASLEGLPSTALVTAGYDPLRDEGVALARRLDAAGVDLAYLHYADMIHGFAGLPGGAAHAGEAVRWVASFLRNALAA